jgi:hypothetical protein
VHIQNIVHNIRVPRNTGSAYYWRLMR